MTVDNRSASDLYALLTAEGTWEKVARSFHAHYERLAPEFGYEVRPDVGQRPFADLPENNRRLMVATAGHVLGDVLDLLESPGHPPAADPHACCKRHVPGPIFTTYADGPDPEFICPECGSRWLWDDDEAEGGGWFYDPENDRPSDEPASHTQLSGESS